jgi:Kef-type K+ transport system membrane component KefB/mannitol/fructose-specific phosphotransferase system IIA component (Ntr-type)
MPDGSDPLLMLGIVLLAGGAGGWLARRVHLPSLTGNILAGVLIGPAFGLVEGEHTLERLQPLNQFAMALVTVAIGGHLSWHRVHNAWSRILSIAFFEVACASLFVTAGLRFLAGLEWPLAILLGAIAASTAPATLIHVSRETHARGPFIKTLLSVVALDNIMAIILFALALPPIALYYRTGAFELTGSGTWTRPLFFLAGSVLLGLAAGRMVQQFAHRRGFHNFSTVFVALLVTTGLASWMGLSPLLAGMFLGVYLANRSRSTGDLLEALEPIERILFTGFFTLAGVTLHLEELAALGFAGVLFVVLRLAGKSLGAAAGGLAVRCSPRIWTNMPLGLVPQAGLAIALVILVQGDPSIPAHVRSTITSLVLAAVVVAEIAGPLTTRMALRRADEAGKDRPRLMEFLQEEYIKTDLQAEDRRDAVRQLCDFLILTHRVDPDKRDSLHEVFAREGDGGYAVAVEAEAAILHARIEEGEGIQGVLGVLPEGVDLGTPDGRRVRLLLMVATPGDQYDRHPEILASLSAMISDDVIRSRLVGARDANEAWEIIEGRETPDYNYFLED